MQASPEQQAPTTPEKREFKSPIQASKCKKDSSSKKFGQDSCIWGASPMGQRAQDSLNMAGICHMQDRLLLHSPTPNPMGMMM